MYMIGRYMYFFFIYSFIFKYLPFRVEKKMAFAMGFIDGVIRLYEVNGAVKGPLRNFRGHTKTV
jgi:hypothetical protein